MRDNFCEARGWDMPMCPTGKGHQGQDIRGASCEDNKWEAVAVADGVITKVTSNPTIALRGTDGTQYEYLQVNPNSVTVKAGDTVKQGQTIARVSNYLDGKPSTTRHLHFNILQTVEINGTLQRVYVPPYSSLIAAYRAPQVQEGQQARRRRRHRCQTARSPQAVVQDRETNAGRHAREPAFRRPGTSVSIHVGVRAGDMMFAVNLATLVVSIHARVRAGDDSCPVVLAVATCFDPRPRVSGRP